MEINIILSLIILCNYESLVLTKGVVFNPRCRWLALNLANTSLECRGNLDFVLALLPWDLGCALFVVFISGLCAIKLMPFGHANCSERLRKYFKLRCVIHRLPSSL